MDEFLTFVSQLAVMKPATIDDTNGNHLKKIQEILRSDEYLAEEKVDGCHYMVVGFRFFSTDAIEKTNNYPHLRDFFFQLEMPNLILDGEINYPGKTSQYVTRVSGAGADTAIAFQNENSPVHYTMWDMLRTPRGTWLLNEPLWKRRKILEEFYARYIANTSLARFIHLTDYRAKDKGQYYTDILNAGGEGIVLKRLDSLYVMGKKPMWQWMKLKQKDTGDLFISGYEPPTVGYKGKDIDNWPYWKEIDGVLAPVTKFYYMDWVGALELSGIVNGQVEKVCTCSGLDESLRQTISENRQTFINRVVKISYMERTEAGIPRHPRFEEFHESKTARECTWNFE